MFNKGNTCSFAAGNLQLVAGIHQLVIYLKLKAFHRNSQMQAANCQ